MTSRRAAVPPPRPGGRSPVELSVVIPAYNEEARLRDGVAEVCRYLRAGGDRWERWEVIVVDDGSTDTTAALAARAAADEPRVRLIRTGVNRGKGHAVRRGVLASRGRRVLFCDADGATPIEELARLADRLDEGYAAAIGSRAGPAARIEVRQHPVRELLGKAGNRLIQVLAVPGVRDTQCGFKLFDGDKARAAFALARTDGWGFDVEILRHFRARGWPVAEVPVRWAHRAGSKVGPLDYARVVAEVVAVRIRTTGRAPGVPGPRRSRDPEEPAGSAGPDVPDVPDGREGTESPADPETPAGQRSTTRENGR
ncbi:dolichyl-phosphate beta-glucosyltransferase [Streptomyces zingiberis]|uniref:dolichyl-phosphate beta-glucosyltransferase n=1 Tax=Streptomyces zingiberis TaxID=2053010 RepID=A0ABX1C102_9ACTN|nr:glycosyltransferase family 2 protein [Streptomyces zingiberis]